MSSDEMTLKLNLMQRPIEFVIRKEWEYYYRKAEDIINKDFLQFAKRWNYTDQQDLLSKMLITYVVKWMENEERLKEYEDELVPMMQKLKEIADGFETGK